MTEEKVVDLGFPKKIKNTFFFIRCRDTRRILYLIELKVTANTTCHLKLRGVNKDTVEKIKKNSFVIVCSDDQTSTV